MTIGEFVWRFRSDATLAERERVNDEWCFGDDVGRDWALRRGDFDEDVELWNAIVAGLRTVRDDAALAVVGRSGTMETFSFGRTFDDNDCDGIVENVAERARSLRAEICSFAWIIFDESMDE